MEQINLKNEVRSRQKQAIIDEKARVEEEVGCHSSMWGDVHEMIRGPRPLEMCGGRNVCGKDRVQR